MKTVGKVIRYTALTISFLIFAFFMFRLFSSGAPRSMTGIAWTAEAEAAYQADPEGFSALEQPQQVMITSDGKFWITNVIYIPAAKQLQLTIKYNDSTLKYLREELGRDTLPEEPFAYSLLDENGVRYENHTSEPEKKLNYNYRLLVFDNIDLSDINSMYVDIYYAEAVDYAVSPYSSLMTWNSALPTIERKDDRK